MLPCLRLPSLHRCHDSLGWPDPPVSASAGITGRCDPDKILSAVCECASVLSFVSSPDCVLVRGIQMTDTDVN